MNTKNSAVFEHSEAANQVRTSPVASVKILQAAAALLMMAVIALLLAGVISRYVFSRPIVWVDEVLSLSFIWMAMLGAALAMHRNEHLRLTLFVEKLPVEARLYVQGSAIALVSVMLFSLLIPAYQYLVEEWPVRTAALNMPNSFRVSAILVGLIAMLAVVLIHAKSTVRVRHLLWPLLPIGIVALGLWQAAPWLNEHSISAIVLFLIVLVAFCLCAGVPIAFCFGLGALSYLTFATNVPLLVMIGRMDEGMSSLVLVSVPVFVLLGCILDATGMGKAIVDFLASLIGHVKAGMSYVLLGALFIVSGISGSKVSDMATVAPALFPEMKRRGHKPKEMVALLATGAAMADTVPPSIVLIVLGAVAGVSIAALFQAGFIIAIVLLLMLLVLARWKARHESVQDAKRAPVSVVFGFLLLAAPALVLPFLIRGLVGGGVATATEVSTIAVVYALVVGQILYGGIGLRRFYAMLVETASLSGAILLILGTASAMAWVITQSGVIQGLSHFLTELPGGAATYLAITIVVFLVLGCLLEGLPAILLLAPLMFPIARQLGIHEIHYSMVVVTAMNIGLMMPPIGVGFYIASRIGDIRPDELMSSIWPYLFALMIGLFVIAAIPSLSTLAINS